MGQKRCPHRGEALLPDVPERGLCPRLQAVMSSKGQKA